MPFLQIRCRLFNVRAIPVLVSIVLCSATASLAQQPSASGQDHPDAPSTTQANNSAPRHSPSGAFFSTLQRKSLVFPDIATSEGPLSSGEKFQLFVNNSISLSRLFASAAGAGIGQATNSPEGYGQGGEGYGKRFGASMARNASSNFFGTFLLASALHQDPRFFPQRNPTFGGSVKYAVRRLFITRSDSGHDTANWSGLLGPALGEGLANAYWPEGQRTAGDTLHRYGVDMATTVGYNILRNYWPIFFKRLRGSGSPGASGKQ
jgi:hypothetical protein